MMAIPTSMCNLTLKDLEAEGICMVKRRGKEVIRVMAETPNPMRICPTIVYLLYL
jgi:hypothetical protein